MDLYLNMDIISELFQSDICKLARRSVSAAVSDVRGDKTVSVRHWFFTWKRPVLCNGGGERTARCYSQYIRWIDLFTTT